MAELVVSASLGMMKPLLTKLATLKGVGKEVVFLVDELSVIDACLEKTEDADELDLLAKNWRSDIREMTYDIEDCIDDFMHHHGGADGKLGFLQKAWSYIKTLNDRFRMANQIQEMKAGVIQASDRRKRYKLDYCVSTSRSMAVDPQLPAFYKESASLVGIDGPRDEESMEAPICALGGAMFKLPRKLDGLLRHVHMLPKGAEDEIPLIRRDLEEIIAILQDHISRLDDHSVMVNCWMKEVRELSYDIEDCIDHYQHAADSKSKYVCKIPHRKFTSRKNSRLPERLKLRLRMANKIREFSARVQEAIQRYEMYNLGGIGRTPPPPPTYDVSFRSPHHIVYGEATDLVGIDAPMNKLEEWLIKDGDQKLKLVSIVGFGGIGKTTLANELSCKLGDQFDCRAFVRASHKPDMRRLLISMLSQVRPHHPPDTWKVHNLIADIRTHLQDKRTILFQGEMSHSCCDCKGRRSNQDILLEMEKLVVSASVGVMKPLLAKLTTLAGDEYKKLKGVRKEAVSLFKELSAMDAFLEKMEDADELDPLAKNWRSDIREMAYDIEDCIDDFMHRLGGADGKDGIVQKTARRLRTLRARHQIANQIQELKSRVLEASERRTRNKLDDSVSTSRSMAVDPRLPALYKESTSLVGIEGPRDELIEWAADEERQLKVVSIVGFGGLGKTTLANEVYCEIRGQFNCKAFVSVSQRPDMTRLLLGLLSKLGSHPSSQHPEVKDLIDDLRKHLQHKRYFIIVDDLWGVPAWETIRCAFPENNQCSRVMVTTRIEDVARACCNNHKCIHVMKTLSHPDSKRLFFNRLFGSEDGCPRQFEEVSDEILKKCGGLPLAITTISGLLASQPARLKGHWENIRNSLGSQFATNPTLEGMRQILNLSYKDLPHHLKTCLLYLGMYPEDHEIWRNNLVRRWIAEGFVSTLHGHDLVDVAESYFNELVNRSLIQPKQTRYNGEVWTCGVHDMMLDLILSKCAEDNFVSVVDDPQSMPGQHDKKVRRLSVLSTVPAIITNLSRLRSLVVFGKSVCIPPLLEFKFLRVLEFEVSGPVEGESRLDLTGITKLFQLRYLKISARNWHSIQLPSQIRGLQQLETLEMWFTGIVNLPADIVDLPCLLHLIVRGGGTRLPDRIGNMKSLRTLERIDLKESSLRNIKALGELTSLRELEFFYGGGSFVATTRMDALRSSVEKLRKLRLLRVCPEKVHLRFLKVQDVISADGLNSLSPPPHHLEGLELRTLSFSRVPRWIGHLHNLHSLTLMVRVLLEDDVRVLGDLPSLTTLVLYILQAPAERIVISGSGMGFLALKRFIFYCDWMSYLTFTAGAMPNIQTLDLQLPLDTWDTVHRLAWSTC